MSDYLTKAKRPGSDEWEPVEMRDNYYGPHNYGVQFPDGHVYPDGDCEIIGEKPWEIWEERFDKEFSMVLYSGDGGSSKDIKSFIAKEIQSAVEAERRRISEEAAYIESHKAFHCRFDELVKVINPKK